MNDLPFQPLLFGGDINVYSVARAFHEAYGVRSIAYGKYPSFPCHGSAIIDYRVCPDNESADAFRRNAKAVAEEFPEYRRGPAGHPHQQGEVLSAVRPVRGGPPGHLHL